MKERKRRNKDEEPRIDEEEGGAEGGEKVTTGRGWGG